MIIIFKSPNILIQYPGSWLVLLIFVGIVLAMSFLPGEMQWVKGEGGDNLTWWLEARTKRNKKDLLSPNGLFKDQVSIRTGRLPWLQGQLSM